MRKDERVFYGIFHKNGKILLSAGGYGSPEVYSDKGLAIHVSDSTSARRCIKDTTVHEIKILRGKKIHPRKKKLSGAKRK